MKARRVRVRYWKPKVNYLEEICCAVERLLEDGDVIAVSEKAVSTATGNIVDEGRIAAGFSARLLARCWMRLGWGYFLGYLCRLRHETIRKLRNYPLQDGACHKQLALEHTGVLQALRFGSEGGIDASNLPYAYVALPIHDPALKAKQIQEAVLKALGKRVIVLLVDSDKVYSLRSFHISPTPTSLPGILSKGGFLLYLVGRLFKLKPRSTPRAIYPPEALNAETALELAQLSHRARGHGAGKTVWDMAERFGVPQTAVTWEMLESLEHYPIVIIRGWKKYNKA